MIATGHIARTTSVKNELGMHARPASKIAAIAQQAGSQVLLCVNSHKVDAASILDILSLGAAKGTRIKIEIEDKKDIKVLEQLIVFFENGFGED